MATFMSLGISVPSWKAARLCKSAFATIHAAVAEESSCNTNSDRITLRGLMLNENEFNNIIGFARQDPRGTIAWMRIDDEGEAFSNQGETKFYEMRAGVAVSAGTVEGVALHNDCSECGISHAELPNKKVSWKIDKDLRDSPMVFASGDILLVNKKLLHLTEIRPLRLRTDLESDGFIPVDVDKIAVDLATLSVSADACASCNRPMSVDSAPSRESLPGGGFLYDGRYCLSVTNFGSSSCYVSQIQIGETEPPLRVLHRIVFISAELAKAISALFGEQVSLYPAKEMCSNDGKDS